MADQRSAGPVRGRVRRGMLALLALAGCALAGCSDRPSSSDCEALLERVIELEVEAAGTAHLAQAMKDDLDKQKKDLREHLREPFLADCKKNMAVDVVKCGLEARSKRELADCEE